MSTRKILLIVLCIVCAAALAAFLLFRNSPEESLPTDTTPVSEAAPPAEGDIGLPEPRLAPPGFDEYQSATYRFSLFFPQDLSPSVFKEPGTAMTVTFEDPFGSRGFQVFVVPYGEKKITPERFKADIPSGIIENSRAIVLDGVPAESFYSSNRALGDTYEIWFIYHGFLYEVTTYKAYDAWLNEIMSTWKFL